MKLSEFLKEVNGKEEDIINYEGDEALRQVKQYGYALRYVNNQTPEICLEAVKQNGYALQFVNNQTPEICLEAVKQDGYALQFVNKSIFEKTHTIVLDGKEIELSEESYNAFKEQFKEE